MKSDLERHYIEKIHGLPRPSGKSVIAMSLFGNSPKYFKGAIENVLLLNTYFPGWTIRFYTPPSPEFSATAIDKLKIFETGKDKKCFTEKDLNQPHWIKYDQILQLALQ